MRTTIGDVHRRLFPFPDSDMFGTFQEYKAWAENETGGRTDIYTNGAGNQALSYAPGLLNTAIYPADFICGSLVDNYISEIT